MKSNKHGSKMGPKCRVANKVTRSMFNVSNDHHTLVLILYPDCLQLVITQESVLQ